ncbi:MAG TPA: hypothetical protein PLR07_12825, partial [Promineifilum sp.]|nr:hypothetical protein [Promineifilum sp.]
MSATDNTNLPAAEPEADEIIAAPPGKIGYGLNPRGLIVILLLLIILALGGWLRFSGIAWDSDSHLHPDERFLTMVGSSISSVDNPLDYFRTSISTLNPYNFGYNLFVYGNLPMTVTRYVGEWAAGWCESAAVRPCAQLAYGIGAEHRCGE